MCVPAAGSFTPRWLQSPSSAARLHGHDDARGRPCSDGDEGSRTTPEVCDLVQTGGSGKPVGHDGSVWNHRQQRPKVEGADCAHAWRVGLPWASPQFEEKQSRHAQPRFRWCASHCRDASAWCLHGRLMRILFGSERRVSPFPTPTNLQIVGLWVCNKRSPRVDASKSW